MSKHPLDSGWAWVIAVVGMVNMFIVVGFINVTGVLFIEMMSTFKTTSTAVALVVGVKEAIFSVCALFTLGPLSDFVHTRVQIMAGGLLMCLGYSLCFFATTIHHMLVYSVFVGIALSLTYFQNVIALSDYFKKWRTLAVGITTSGVSLGTITLPFLVEYLLEQFSFKGCMLIIGAIFLHLTIFGSLMRPPDFYNRKSRKPYLTTDSGSEVKPIEFRATPSQHKPYTDLTFIGERLEKPIFKREYSISEGDLLKPENGCLSHKHSLLTGSHPELNICNVYRAHPQPKYDLTNFLTLNLFRNGFSTNSIFFDEYYEQGEKRELDRLDDAEYHVIFKQNRQKVKVIDTNLLKNGAYMSYMISVSMCQTANSMTFIFLPPYATDILHDISDVTILISVYGIFNFVSRFLFGYLSDSGLLQRHRMSVCTCILLGVLANLSRLFTNFYWWLAYAIIQGSLMSCFFVTTPVILIDFFGREVQGRSIGSSLFLTGIVNLVLAPILGYIRDVTGSYATSFNIIGMLFIFGSVVLGCVTVPLRRRQQKKLDNDIILDV